MRLLMFIFLCSCGFTYQPGLRHSVSVHNHPYASSGVIVNGVILTTKHSARDSSIIITHKGDTLLSSEITLYAKHDLAVINTFVRRDTVKFGKVKVGDEVYCISNTAGLPFTYSRGYVMHPSRIDPLKREGEFIQIALDVHGGASGAGLWNNKGELVGIVSFYITDTRIFFAVPIEYYSKMNKAP